MILHQQNRTVPPLDTLGHIALLAPNLGQGLRAPEQPRSSFLHPSRVRISLPLGALVEQTLQSGFAECRAHGANHFQRQLGMAVGEARGRSGG